MVKRPHVCGGRDVDRETRSTFRVGVKAPRLPCSLSQNHPSLLAPYIYVPFTPPVPSRPSFLAQPSPSKPSLPPLSHTPVSMDRWRNFFKHSNVDIWTIIEKSILVAAVYHPDVFKHKRCDIAETLFAPNLVQHSHPETVESLQHQNEPDEARLMEKCALSGDKEEGFQRILPSGGGSDQLCADSDEARDQEGLLVQKLEKIKEIILDDSQPESVLLAALQRLENFKITVGALKVTEIGRHVNNMRKHPCKDIRIIAKMLVRHWKLLLDDWVKISEGAPGIPDCRGVPEELNCPQSLNASSPSTTITSIHEVSQLVRFIDGGLCEQTKSVEELSIKGGSVSGPSKSLSRSLQTDTSSCCHGKLSVSHSHRLDALGEMGSANRDNFEKDSKSLSRESSNQHDAVLSGLPASRVPVKQCLSARHCEESETASISGSEIRSRSAEGSNQSHVIEKNVVPKYNGGCVHPTSLGDKRIEKSRADQKLEDSKRKLREGYQIAENAKKQRTVQVLDFSDMPRSDVCEKTNAPSLFNKGGNYKNRNKWCG